MDYKINQFFTIIQNLFLIMTLPKDPFMLYSLINMKLRDQYPDLSSLCSGLDIDQSELEQTLGDAGFKYDPTTNSFR